MEYIKIIRKFRGWLLAINLMVLLGSIVFYYASYHHLAESSISFYIAGLHEIDLEDMSKANGDKVNVVLHEQDRFLSFGNSLWVKQKLIEKFELGAWSEGNGEKSHEMNRTLQGLSTKYSVRVNARQELLVTVEDPDIKRAYDMAEEIIRLTNQMNNDYLLRINDRQQTLCRIQLKTLKNERERTFVQMDSIKLSFSKYIELDEVIFSLENVLDKISQGQFEGKENIKNYSKLMQLQARIDKLSDKVTSLEEEMLEYEKIMRNTVVAEALIKDTEPVIIESRIPSRDYSDFEEYLRLPILSLLVSLFLTITPLIIWVQYEDHLRFLFT